MKEVEKIYLDNEVKTEIRAEVKKEVQLIGQQRKVPGHILWEYNATTLILKRVQLKKNTTAVVVGDISKTHKNLTTNHRRLDASPECLYYQALNRKNAIKYLKRYHFPVKYEKGDKEYKEETGSIILD